MPSASGCVAHGVVLALVQSSRERPGLVPGVKCLCVWYLGASELDVWVSVREFSRFHADGKPRTLGDEFERARPEVRSLFGATCRSFSSPLAREQKLTRHVYSQQQVSGSCRLFCIRSHDLPSGAHLPAARLGHASFVVHPNCDGPCRSSGGTTSCWGRDEQPHRDSSSVNEFGLGRGRRLVVGSR